MSIKSYSIHIKKHKRITSAVHMVYRLVNSTYTVKELILRLSRLLCQFIHASSCSIYILDPQKKKLTMVGIFNNKINILLTKKKDLAKITRKENQVMQGYILFEKHLLGLPLVAEENIGAIILRRSRKAPAFDEFDKDMLSVIAEQSVTAIKNLQLNEEQQKIILGSIEIIGKLLEKYEHSSNLIGKTDYFNIAKHLGKKLNMRQEGINNLYYACILRDIGALDVPYEILSKKSQLTSEEFQIIHSQPARSVELMKPIEFLTPVLPIILYHHEKYDGSGYPLGLKRDEIPLGARIIGVVEAYEAMTRERPYKHRLTIKEAIEEIQQNSGTQFDPKVVEAFVSLSKQKKFRKYLSSHKE